MTSGRRRLFSYPLSLAVVIAMLIAATGGWIAWWNYRSGIANIRSLANDLFDQVARQTAGSTQAFLATAPPAANTLRGLAQLDPADLDRDALARRFVATLSANPQFAWVSYSDAHGAFVGATRTNDRISVNQSRIVDGKTVRDEHTIAPDGTWTDATRTDDTGYDPRTRSFYLLASRASGGIWTPPYVFAGQMVPGITFAIADRRAGSLVGVFTVDFSLARLTELARELQFSEHGRVVILAADNTVLAHPSAPVVVPAATPGGEPALVHANTLADRAVAMALAGEGDGPFELDGTAYLGRSVPISLDGGQTWRVLAYAPESDFTSGLRGRVISSLLISLIAVIIAVAVASVLARRISVPLIALAREMTRAGELRLDDDDDGGSMFREIQHMNTALAKMKGGLRSFSRYVPRDLVRKLVASGKDAVLAGETRELTIFFSDLAGFTSLAESRTPDELVKLLGVYFDDVSQIIADERGTLDKYIGDGIMAFWNAPEAITDHPFRACVAALRSYRCVHEPLAMRIGIATGDVLVGNIGSHERMNYTAMGDAANLAARLESLNKQYNTSVMIAESTRIAAGDAIVARPIDVVAVKGKSQGVRVYELLALAAEDDAKARAVAATSTIALDAYLARDFAKAAAAWDDVLALRPDDVAATLMRDRARGFEGSPPDADWTGITIATEK